MCSKVSIQKIASEALKALNTEREHHRQNRTPFRDRMFITIANVMDLPLVLIELVRAYFPVRTYFASYTVRKKTDARRRIEDVRNLLSHGVAERVLGKPQVDHVRDAIKARDRVNIRVLDMFVQDEQFCWHFLPAPKIPRQLQNERYDAIPHGHSRCLWNDRMLEFELEKGVFEMNVLKVNLLKIPKRQKPEWVPKRTEK